MDRLWTLGCRSVNDPRPNHNMDPNIVNSASFGLQWKVPFNTNEQVGMIHDLQRLFGIFASTDTFSRSRRDQKSPLRRYSSKCYLPLEAQGIFSSHIRSWIRVMKLSTAPVLAFRNPKIYMSSWGYNDNPVFIHHASLPHPMTDTQLVLCQAFDLHTPRRRPSTSFLGVESKLYSNT